VNPRGTQSLLSALTEVAFNASRAAFTTGFTARPDWVLKNKAVPKAVTLQKKGLTHKKGIRLIQCLVDPHQRISSAMVLIDQIFINIKKNLIMHKLFVIYTIYTTKKFWCPRWIQLNSYAVVSLTISCTKTHVGMARKKYVIDYPSLYAVPGTKRAYAPVSLHNTYMAS